MSNSKLNHQHKRALKFRERLKNVKGPKQVFILDPSNVDKLFYDKFFQKALNNVQIMYKITIQNTIPFSPRLALLKAVVEQAKPELLVPFEISCIKNAIQFYCMNSGPALERFCKQQLYLNFKQESKEIKLPMTLSTSANPNHGIQGTRTRLIAILKPRIVMSPKVAVDLSNFSLNQNQKMYLDITDPKYLNYVLGCVKYLRPQILNLSNINLVSLKFWKNAFLSLESIDLSRNQIESLDDLGNLLTIDLKEINLSFNPLVRQFRCLKDLEDKVKEYFPNAKVISSRPETYDQRISYNSDSNFAVSPSAGYFVDQFMDHYFTLYDNPKKRMLLQDMYHPDALFSLTSEIINELQPNGMCSDAQIYKHHAHNLLDPKQQPDYYFGSSEIIRKLCHLPETHHDCYTLNIDVLHFIENVSAMFIIYGVFCEPLRPSIKYCYQRTFRIIGVENGEYLITNDLLYITNVPNQILTKAFYWGKHLTLDISDKLPLPPVVSKEQKDCVLAIFCNTTDLHVKYARRFLEHAEWNIPKALETFVYEFRFDLISPKCFIQSDIKQLVANNMPYIGPGFSKENIAVFLQNMEKLEDDKYILGKSANQLVCKKMMATVREMLLKGTRITRPGRSYVKKEFKSYNPLPAKSYNYVKEKSSEPYNPADIYQEENAAAEISFHSNSSHSEETFLKPFSYGSEEQDNFSPVPENSSSFQEPVAMAEETFLRPVSYGSEDKVPENSNSFQDPVAMAKELVTLLEQSDSENPRIPELLEQLNRKRTNSNQFENPEISKPQEDLNLKRKRIRIRRPKQPQKISVPQQASQIPVIGSSRR